jgi:hypothetical protein
VLHVYVQLASSLSSEGCWINRVPYRRRGHSEKWSMLSGSAQESSLVLEEIVGHPCLRCNGFQALRMLKTCRKIRKDVRLDGDELLYVRLRADPLLLLSRGALSQRPSASKPMTNMRLTQNPVPTSASRGNFERITIGEPRQPCQRNGFPP